MRPNAIKELLEENLITGSTGQPFPDQSLLELLNPPSEAALTLHTVKAKNRLEASDIPVPETLELVEQQSEIPKVIEMLVKKGTPFVVKPVHSTHGRGVLPCLYADESGVTKLSGEHLSIDTLKFHFYQILHGEFSPAGKPDVVMVEEYLQTSRQWIFPVNPGAPALRLILCMNKLVAAEIRLPTLNSNGRVNVSCGAIRVPVDLETGLTLEGILEDEPIQHHPDTGIELAGQEVENLPAAMDLGQRCCKVFNLGFLAVDIIEDVMETLVVLGIDASPRLCMVQQEIHPEQ
ncbi:MAG: sugar-transfer associated ATP-grasp domain-containing protein [Puniceicoccaceae bacterium]